MFDIRPPIDERELRVMLGELDLEIDETIFPQMLAAVQPVRARLRVDSEKQRRTLLRGVALAAGGITPGHPAVFAKQGVDVEPEEVPRARPTVRDLIARLGALYLAMVTGTFALMSIGSRGVFIVFVSLTGVLLFCAITGWGTAGQEVRLSTRARSPEPVRDTPARSALRIAGTIIGIALLVKSGIAPLLLLTVWSVFDPRFHMEGDVISRALQLVGILVLFIVTTHWLKVRRR